MGCRFGSATRLSFAGYFLVDCVDEFVAAGKVVVVDPGREVLLVAGDLVVAFRGFSSILADDTLRGGGGRRERNDGVAVTADLGMAIAMEPVRSFEV